jgi:regulatory protein
VKAQRSLKARALQLLAQRDQSRLELRRKLLRHARALAVEAAGAQSVADPEDALPPHAGIEEVDALLDWLEANRYLSDARFAESRIAARQARFGLQRIRSELAQHAVDLPPELADALAASELDRAAAVRERRFGRLPASAAERASQSRFLLGRGFSAELVQRLMRRLARGDDSVGALIRRPD